MDKGSEFILTHVHPDLVKVIRATPQEPQPFVVVYGIRTQEAEKQAVETGHSTTMHSRHLANKEGLSCAVDVAALKNGEIFWAKGSEKEVYGQIWAQVEQTYKELNIILEWGGAWETFKDWGHIQLPWSVE